MSNFRTGSKSIRKQIKNIISEKYNNGIAIIKELIEESPEKFFDILSNDR